MSAGSLVPPTLLLAVVDLERSRAYYRDLLDLPELPSGPASARFDLGLSQLLLVPAEAEPSPAGQEQRLAPGEAVFVRSDGLDALAARLTADGAPLRWVARWWGERRLEIADPDGYVVTFWERWTPTPDDTRALFEEGLRRLVVLVDRLDAEQLEQRAHRGGWSVRQIVHHLADTTAAAYQPLLQTLAEPGSVWQGVPYRADLWALRLDAGQRPLGPSLALLRAVVAAELALVEDLPDAWRRASFDLSGGERLVGDLLARQLGHLLEHLEEIAGIATHGGRRGDASEHGGRAW